MLERCFESPNSMAESINPDLDTSRTVDFFRVSITSGEIVDDLKQEIELRAVCQRILEKKVVQYAAQERAITVSSTDLQEEADRMRREMHLERASDTLTWLSQQLLTPEDWEAGIRDRLLRLKLQEALFSQEVDKFFAQHRLDFEQVILYRIIIPYAQLAYEIYYQIEEAEISFYEAAHLYDLDAKQRYQCGYVGAVHRWNLHPDLASRVFSASPGEVISPIQIENQYYLLKVEEFIPAQLTTENRQMILSNLFADWLEAEVNYLLHQTESLES